MRQQLRESWLPILLYVVFFVVSYSVADWFFPESDGLYLLIFVVDWGALYLLFRTLLRDGGYQRNKTREVGFARYAVMQFLTGIPIVLGYFALILPGAFFAMRWLPAYVRLFVAEGGVLEAMSWSWRETKPVQRDLAKAMLGPIACLLITLAAFLYYYQIYLVDDSWERSIPFEIFSIILINTSICIGLIWYTLLGFSAFRLIHCIVAEDINPA